MMQCSVVKGSRPVDIRFRLVTAINVRWINAHLKNYIRFWIQAHLSLFVKNESQSRSFSKRAWGEGFSTKRPTVNMPRNACKQVERHPILKYRPKTAKRLSSWKGQQISGALWRGLRKRILWLKVCKFDIQVKESGVLLDRSCTRATPWPCGTMPDAPQDTHLDWTLGTFVPHHESYDPSILIGKQQLDQKGSQTKHVSTRITMFSERLQVRGRDVSLPYHHTLTVSSLGNDCQVCIAPLLVEIKNRRH